MDTDLAWAAGFMDGEGTITIKRYVRDNHIQYLAYMSCAQVNKPNNRIALERLKTLFNGGKLYHYETKSLDNRLDVLSWNITSKNAYLAAQALLPWLVIKKEQAQVLIDFCEATSLKKAYRLSTEDYQVRSDFFDKMRKLNVKGKLRLQRLSEETPKGDATV